MKKLPEVLEYQYNKYGNYWIKTRIFEKQSIEKHICKSYRRYPRKRYLRYFMKKFEIKLRKA